MEKKRSVGVIAVSATIIINNLIYLFIAAPLFLKHLSYPTLVIYVVESFLLSLLAVSSIVIAVGIIFSNKEFFRSLLTKFQIFTIIVLIPILLQLTEYVGMTGKIHFPGIRIALILSIPIFLSLFYIIFLTRPKVKEQFE